MTAKTKQYQNKRLAGFCHRTIELADRIEQLVMFDGTLAASSQNALPAEFKAILQSLQERSRRPEINVLLLGPLKAGKSTGLNLLLDNPLLSQVTQLPAYPCTVEVRDLQRDDAGDPVEQERALFYAEGNAAPEEMSLQEGQARLNELLSEYIHAGADAVIKYPRVVQKVDLNRSPDDLNLIVYDSPGLFFSMRLDQHHAQAPGQGADSEYSRATRELSRQADIAVFIIRPEQLFQDYVVQWLRNFTFSMRFFILVNGSKSAMQWRNGQVVTHDQVLNQDELREYFEQHIADPHLVGRIRQKAGISLHFTDLLEVTRARFVNQEDRSICFQTIYGEALAEIDQYLRSEAMADRKIENLGELRNEVIRQAWNHLSDVKEKKEERQRRLAEEQRALGAKIEDQAAALAALEEQLRQWRAELKAIGVRNQVADSFINPTAQPAGAGHDPEAEWLLALNRLQINSNGALARRPEDVEAEVKRILGKVYLSWKNGGNYGGRNLRSLADAVWTRKVEDGIACLREQFIIALRAMTQDFFREAMNQTASGSSLYQAIIKSNARTLDIPADNPIIKPANNPAGKPVIALLPFTPVNTWTENESSLTGEIAPWVLNPAKLWGEQADLVVPPKRDQFLAKRQKHFVNCIWGDPWNLKDCFDPVVLDSKARRIGLQEICRQWKQLLAARREESGREIPKLEGQIAKSAQELAQLQTQLAALDQQMEEIRIEVDNLAERLRSVKEIGLDVHAFVTEHPE